MKYMPFAKLLVSNVVISLSATIEFTKTPLVLNISILTTLSTCLLAFIVIVFENGFGYNTTLFKKRYSTSTRNPGNEIMPQIMFTMNKLKDLIRTFLSDMFVLAHASN